MVQGGVFGNGVPKGSHGIFVVILNESFVFESEVLGELRVLIGVLRVDGKEHWTVIRVKEVQVFNVVIREGVNPLCIGNIMIEAFQDAMGSFAFVIPCEFWPYRIQVCEGVATESVVEVLYLANYAMGSSKFFVVIENFVEVSPTSHPKFELVWVEIILLSKLQERNREL